MNETEKREAIEAIKKHFATLEKGQRSHQEHVYTEEEANAYAERHDVAYPGLYLSPEGALLVPPGLVFLRPAATFGITEPDAPEQSKFGIFTRTHRRYFRPVCVGKKVVFDGHIIDTYERRGYYYLVVRWEAKDEEGTLLAKGDEWHTLGFAREGA
ncbi:MAG: hypothetical protein GY866_09355 [Proteobacteria bacterium]|nr:hypothetical protein [Pseudomonadota bacterium]